MTLQRLPDGSVQVAHLDEWHLQMLRSIPSLASAGEDREVRNGLFPRPFSPGDATEENFRDWDELVRPELEQLFTDSLQHVAKDLEQAEPEPVAPTPPGNTGESSDSAPPAPARKRRKGARSTQSPPASPSVQWGFKIPADHVEDWYRAMNQARLMLSAKHEAHRTDNAHIASMFISGKMEALIQYELLTGLCSWWVDALLRP